MPEISCSCCCTHLRCAHICTEGLCSGQTRDSGEGCSSPATHISSSLPPPHAAGTSRVEWLGAGRGSTAAACAASRKVHPHPRSSSIHTLCIELQQVGHHTVLQPPSRLSPCCWSPSVKPAGTFMTYTTGMPAGTVDGMLCVRVWCCRCFLQQPAASQRGQQPQEQDQQGTAANRALPGTAKQGRANCSSSS